MYVWKLQVTAWVQARAYAPAIALLQSLTEGPATPELRPQLVHLQLLLGIAQLNAGDLEGARGSFDRIRAGSAQSSAALNLLRHLEQVQS